MLALPLRAVEVEGTVWYDAEGKVALVEGPAAESAPVPFVPEWRKREIARQERGYTGRSGIYFRDFWRGYGAYGYYRSYRPRGWCVRRAVPYRRGRGGFYGAYRGSRGSGVTVVIRR